VDDVVAEVISVLSLLLLLEVGGIGEQGGLVLVPE
jgi:hypothetical protein